jgi:hypothetical protein
MRVRYHIDWMASHEFEADFPPGTPLMVAAKSVLESMGNPSFGLVTTNRRWTDYRLPGVELLEALATAYGRCADLLIEAHRASQTNACTIHLATTKCACDTGGPECMVNAERWTEASVDASTGEVRSLRHKIFESREDVMKEAIQLYGLPDDLTSRIKGGGALGAVDVFLEMGQRILAVDTDLMMLCVYFNEDRILHIEGGNVQDHFGKVLWADHLASRAMNVGATSLLISADIWEATLTRDELDRVPPMQRPDRTEALSVMAVCRDGRSLSKRLPYTRRPDGGADFGEVMVDNVGLTHYLEPLRKAWGLEKWEDAC